MQGNDVLATAKQAVAGMGSLFGSASKRLDWIGSSIDKKAQELLPKLAISPKERGNNVEGLSSKASPAKSPQKSLRDTEKGSSRKSSPQVRPAKQYQGLKSQNSEWDWGEDESPQSGGTR